MLFLFVLLFFSVRIMALVLKKQILGQNLMFSELPKTFGMPE